MLADTRASNDKCDEPLSPSKGFVRHFDAYAVQCALVELA